MVLPVLLRAHTFFQRFVRSYLLDALHSSFHICSNFVAGCREEKQFLVVGTSRRSSSREQARCREYFVIVSWRW